MRMGIWSSGAAVPDMQTEEELHRLQHFLEEVRVRVREGNELEGV